MGDFDVDAYFAALDDERCSRGLSWAALTRELNAPFAHRQDIPPISSSTLTGMRSRGALNGNIVVHTLMWLGRTPEEFTIGHPVEAAPLPSLETGFLPRWNCAALFEALDDRRRQQGLTWAEVARRVGHFTPEMLGSVRRSVGFPRVMRLLAWLDRPAADFVVNAPV